MCLRHMRTQIQTLLSVFNTMHVMFCLCSQASLSLCMLLVLKKYLNEAYKLTNERVAAYNPQDTALRGQEEKTPVAKV